MKTIPDKFFDLCIADPPYGIKMHGGAKPNKHRRRKYDKKEWDYSIPKKEVFDEMLRVSKNQIIWGGNYFLPHLNEGHMGWIVWYKLQKGLTMSDCELAYSNFDRATRVFEGSRFLLAKENPIHPTQKPIALYNWILDNYANGGGKIFDPFLGSGSSRIAAYMKGFDFWACELDQEYFKAQEERFRRECFGEQKMKNGAIIEQMRLF